MREVMALVKIYKYEDLSGDAQEIAVDDRQIELEAQGYGWAEEAIATLRAFEQLFQGEFTTLIANTYEFNGCLPRLKWLNTKTEDLTGAALREYIGQHYMHKQTEGGELIIKGYENYTLTECHLDTFILEDLADFMEHSTDGCNRVISFPQLIRECLESWADQCSADWEGLMDEDSVKEGFNDDDAEFFGDGIRYKEPATDEPVDEIDLPRKIQA